MRVLTRAELTATLAHRQGLITRWRVTPSEAIRRLTPLQGQHAPAPFIALAARLHDFEREQLEQAIDAKHVVKTTIMRLTLHLAATADYPAYAQLARQPWLRRLKTTVDARELAGWLETPRTNAEIREKIQAGDLYTPILEARTVVPLVQLPPAGHFTDNGRNTRFVRFCDPLPTPAEAAKTVLTRYLSAFGPAQRRDVAAWSGAAQKDFDFDAIPTVRYRDEHGRELLDLPHAPILPADTALPPRLLARWDQPLLAYKDRDRIIPPELLPLRLTLSGDQTLTVRGRVAASWAMRGNKLVITPHTGFPREGVEEEALRTARFLGVTRPKVIIE